MDSILALHPLALGLILGAIEIFGTKIYDRHCLVSERCQLYETTKYKIVVQKSSWSISRALATKNVVAL